MELFQESNKSLCSQNKAEFQASKLPENPVFYGKNDQ
jgi:hypothetical protein